MKYENWNKATVICNHIQNHEKLLSEFKSDQFGVHASEDINWSASSYFITIGVRSEHNLAYAVKDFQETCIADIEARIAKLKSELADL